MNQPINHRGWGGYGPQWFPPLRKWGWPPHPSTFYEFLVKRVFTPTFQDHWGVGLPQLRLPGVVSPPVMGLQACPNLLFGENRYRRLDPKIPVMGENRDRYLFCAAWHGGHSGTGLGLWWPLVSEKNGKSVMLGKKKPDIFGFHHLLNHRLFFPNVRFHHQLFFRNVTGFITCCEPQGVSISRCWFRRSEILDPRCSWRKIRKIHESSKFVQNESTVVHLCALKDEKTPTDAIWVCQQWQCFTASKTLTNASLWLSNWKLLERFVTKICDLPRVSPARKSLKIVQLKRVSQRETTKMS